MRMGCCDAPPRARQLPDRLELLLGSWTMEARARRLAHRQRRASSVCGWHHGLAGRRRGVYRLGGRGDARAAQGDLACACVHAGARHSAVSGGTGTSAASWQDVAMPRYVVTLAEPAEAVSADTDETPLIRD